MLPVSGGRLALASNWRKLRGSIPSGREWFLRFMEEQLGSALR
jgi:hypothetical protein